MGALVLTSATLLGLAAWILWIRFNSRPNRALALYLVLRALDLACLLLERDAGQRGTGLAGLYAALGGYTSLGSVVALAYFCTTIVAPAPVGRARFLPLAFTAAAAATLGWYAVDHDALYPLGGYGPLYIVQQAHVPILAVGGFLSIRKALHLPPGPRHESSFLVGLALTASAATDGAVSAIVPPAVFIDIWVGSTMVVRTVANLLYVGGFVLAVATTCLILASSRWTRRRRVNAAAVVFGCVGIVTAGSFWEYLGFFDDRDYARMLRVVRLVLPALLAWAIVRHRLFDPDGKQHFVIKHGTVAACFLAFAFVATEGVQTFFVENGKSPYLAIGAAGVLALALHPLQRLGERLATFAAHPGDRLAPIETDPRRRYAEQAVLMWRDGQLEAREKELLERMRRELGLTIEDAWAIEQVAMQAKRRKRAPAA
jgi:hypothetical protein